MTPQLSLGILAVSCVVFLALLPVLKLRITDSDSLADIARRGITRIPVEWDFGDCDPFPVRIVVRAIYATIFASIIWYLVGIRFFGMTSGTPYVVSGVLTVVGTFAWVPWARFRNEVQQATRKREHPGVGFFIYGWNVYKFENGPMMTIAINAITMVVAKLCIGLSQ